MKRLARPHSTKNDKKQFAAFCSSANCLLPKIHFREVLNRGWQNTKFYGQSNLFSRSNPMKELNLEQMAQLDGGMDCGKVGMAVTTICLFNAFHPFGLAACGAGFYIYLSNC